VGPIQCFLGWIVGVVYVYEGEGRINFKGRRNFGDGWGILDTYLGQAWLVKANMEVYASRKDLELVFRKWGEGLVVLKGIKSVSDTERAVDLWRGIIVSNHGVSILIYHYVAYFSRSRWLSSRRRYLPSRPLLC
jgi:isopentenyl diphosphate isomerase/L-lactate dehydrogenase-like FMN-dependent dehydrogenase